MDKGPARSLIALLESVGLTAVTVTRRADAVAATCITFKRRRVEKKSKLTMVALVEEGRLTFHRTSGKCATLGGEEGGEEGKLARTTWRSCW